MQPYNLFLPWRISYCQPCIFHGNLSQKREQGKVWHNQLPGHWCYNIHSRQSVYWLKLRSPKVYSSHIFESVFTCVLWFQFLSHSVTYFFHADHDSPVMAYGCDFSFWWPMVVIVNGWCCDFDFCFWTMDYGCYFSFWTMKFQLWLQTYSANCSDLWFVKWILWYGVFIFWICVKLDYVMNLCCNIGCWAVDFSNIL
jgi:hypothetical protein